MKKRKQNKKEYIYIAILFSILVFSFLFLTGTISSGIHLIDDHEFLKVKSGLEKIGFWKELFKVISSDLRIRFRILYWMERVIGVFLFGDNTVLWSISKAIEITLSMWLLYIVARKLQTSKIMAVLFALLVFCGEQAAVWWRLGPQESFGMLLFSLTMLATWRLNQRKNGWNTAFFLSSILLLSLQKESFTVAVPGFLFLLAAYDLQNETGSLKERCISFCKKYLFEICMILICFLVEVYIIVFKVGTDSIGYAGFSSDFGWKSYVIAVLENMKKSCMFYLLLAIVLLLIIQIEFRKSMLSYQAIGELIFCSYLFVVEQLSYAKSGMWERYLLPWAISILYPLCIMGYRVIKKNKRVVVAVLGILIIAIVYQGSRMLPTAREFAKKGEQLQDCIEFVLENSNLEDTVVSVTRTPEEDMAFDVILRERYDYQHCETIADYESNISDLQNAKVLFGRRGQVYYRLQEEAELSLDRYIFFETEYYEVGISK